MSTKFNSFVARNANIILIVGLVLAAIVVLVFSASTANAASEGPHTIGTAVHGERHVVVNRHKVVTFSNLPSCQYEDGGENQPCSWNFANHHDGNGRGLAYWIDRNDGTHYVWPTRKAALHGGFQWVSKRDAKALASTGNRTPAYWRACAVRFGDDFTQLRCADGYRYADNA